MNRVIESFFIFFNDLSGELRRLNLLCGQSYVINFSGNETSPGQYMESVRKSDFFANLTHLGDEVENEYCSG